MSVINYISENYQAILTAIVSVLTGVIAVSLLIPGEQPEKFLQGVVDVITKLSNKPRDK